MNAFVILLLCVQACLIQNVYTQCQRAPACGWDAPALAAPLAYEASPPAYGGSGVGEVAVRGELPVSGNTLVAGQVPILGAVDFSGSVPAAGEVSIWGRCEGCGCGGGY